MIITKKKTLIICPNCEAKGNKSILGELGTAGEFIVQRFHQGETIIKSSHFTVVCGKCLGTAYYRNEKDLPNPGKWLRFQQIEVNVGIQGTLGSLFA